MLSADGEKLLAPVKPTARRNRDQHGVTLPCAATVLVSYWCHAGVTSCRRASTAVPQRRHSRRRDSSESVERLAVALEAAARLAILDALSEAVGEITSQLAPGSVDLRLRGRDVEFAVSKPAAEAAEGPPDAAQPAGVR